jgi:hypothetical protein
MNTVYKGGGLVNGRKKSYSFEEAKERNGLQVKRGTELRN